METTEKNLEENKMTKDSGNDKDESNYFIPKRIRTNLSLKSNIKDDDIVKKIIYLLSQEDLTVDRASRVLEDARSMLPYVSKLPHIKDACD